MNLSNFFNKKNLKKYSQLVSHINLIQTNNYQNLTVQELAQKLFSIKENSSMKEKEKILHAMAITRVASSQILKMAHYDVQLIGALALVSGQMAEMKTGEGKTLTCSAAVAANFVLGYKTHVATANEYLAERDEKTLKPLYSALGISSSYCVSKMDKNQKKEAYSCDVIYSTAQELGFDFLRDNLVYSLEEKMQPLDFGKIKAIIDEADFILIDEARTPLIISGEAPNKDINNYELIKNIAASLTKMEQAPETTDPFNTFTPPGDFWIDEKHKTVYLSDQGYETIEAICIEKELISNNPETQSTHRLSTLYQNHNVWIIHEILNALKAIYCYIRDKDYIVHNNEIVIIDQNTGRLSEGRSWSNGLHQAIEAKENVDINPENMTIGSISIQNYFRNYIQISGMSGTIMESTEEFQQIYNTTTIRIPTNKNMIRKDYQDKVYLSLKAKYNGIIEDIVERHKKGQPILVGTTSVAESETISSLLQKNNIKHHVLNAKNHYREAQIIAQAGQPYSVTVSTSMAGRGTDIILGGNKEALLSILYSQIESLNERRAFFLTLAEQLQLNSNTDDENTNDDELININSDHIDHEDVQQQIDFLYRPEYINSILQEGTHFIKHHIAILEHSVQKQIAVVETSHTKWREHVLNIGGLYVLGSSRNESRRIDDQLRGRSGRQGDPGESTFYLSIEDPWVNVFGKNPLFHHLAKTLPEDLPISSPMVTKGFAKAQKNIEAHHFNMRKDVFQYDSIADEGRRQFLQIRNLLLKDSETTQSILRSTLIEIMTPISNEDFYLYIDEKQNLQIDNQEDFFKKMIELSPLTIRGYFNDFTEANPLIKLSKNKTQYISLIEDKIAKLLADCTQETYMELNSLAIHQLDKKWREHLVFIDDARQNVSFSFLIQKNPLYEFKKLCFESFGSMIEEFRQQLVEDFYQLLTPKEEVSNEPIIQYIPWQNINENEMNEIENQTLS